MSFHVPLAKSVTRKDNKLTIQTGRSTWCVYAFPDAVSFIQVRPGGFKLAGHQIKELIDLLQTIGNVDQVHDR